MVHEAVYLEECPTHIRRVCTPASVGEFHDSMHSAVSLTSPLDELSLTQCQVNAPLRNRRAVKQTARNAHSLSYTF